MKKLTLLQRIKNLWALSSLLVVDKGDNVSIKNDAIVVTKHKTETQEDIKRPVIIKRTTPAEDFLSNT